MPWLDSPKPACTHPNRPELRAHHRGEVWECEACGGQWRARYEDMGHDVMPGELGYQMSWEPVRKP
jgi:hypothetical protein